MCGGSLVTKDKDNVGKGKQKLQIGGKSAL